MGPRSRLDGKPSIRFRRKQSIDLVIANDKIRTVDLDERGSEVRNARLTARCHASRRQIPVAGSSDENIGAFTTVEMST